MKKLSESIWMDIHKQSSGDIDRQEDDYTNIRLIKPVDMGVSVLWSDRDLELQDGSYTFEYDDISNVIQKSKWRIPTKEEVSELFESANRIDQAFKTCTIYGKSKIIFNKRVYVMPPFGSEEKKHSWAYSAWTSDEAENNGHWGFDIFETMSYKPITYSKCKLSVRLVQDK